MRFAKPFLCGFPVVLAAFFSLQSWAGEWSVGNPNGVAASPYGACKAWYDYLAGLSGNGFNSYSDLTVDRLDATYFSCGAIIYSNGVFLWDFTANDFYRVFLEGECTNKQFLDVDTQACRNIQVSPKQKGQPQEKVCSVTGDPIDFIVGNEIESEVDYSISAHSALTFSRFYNSLDGVWRHNWSAHSRVEGGRVVVVLGDAREVDFFIGSGISANSDDGRSEQLAVVNGLHVYTTNQNEKYTFDATDQLIQFVNAQGEIFTLTHNGQQVTVQSNLGPSLVFTEDAMRQPLSLTAPGVAINYTYNAQTHLTALNKTYGTQMLTRLFHYEDSRDPSLLTGITNEQGIRDATWTYDSLGRAISSQHANGIGKVSIAYNVDGTTIVTNELGKQTLYNFITINDVKHIASIQGEPSPNCPASNSSYTYNTNGQVITKTDAKGYITTYTYNDRGLESSRTEASGTSLARTTTTTWDPSRFLRTQVVEPNRTTVYSYDAQGRQISQVTTPH